VAEGLGGKFAEIHGAENRAETSRLHESSTFRDAVAGNR
jgi:hypothetical protein